MKLNQTQEQRQIMTQAMGQSLDILQMPLTSLRSYLEETLLGNPLAEVDCGCMETVSIEHVLRSWESTELSQGLSGKDGIPLPEWTFHKSGDETLAEHLLFQLKQDRRLPSEYLINCCFLVENLNRQGYLDEPVEVLADVLGIPEEDMMQALYVVQSLTPAGVGARSLEECLTLQLVQTKDFNAYTLRIISDHLPRLAKEDYRSIAGALGIRRQEAEHYCAVIRELNPIPSRGFAEAEPEQFVVPEAVVEKGPDGLTVYYNQRYLPQIRINSTYAELSKSGDGELQTYLERQVRQIRKLQEDLDNRKKTFLRILEHVLAVQQEYIAGMEDTPKPMTARDVANILGIHPSTVSRAVRGKYVTLPIGTVELKKLFSAPSGGRGDVSRQAIRQHLRQLVDAENPVAPLSDESLRIALRNLGISLSRRTVAIYRADLGIPPAAGRRRKI